MNREKKICPYDGVEFIPKHGNQKFDTPECKNKYYRDIAKKKGEEKKEAAKAKSDPSWENREILHRKFTQGITLLRGDYLDTTNFNPSKYTSLIEGSGGYKIPVYHDYKLIKLAPNQFKIQPHDNRF